MFFTSSPLHRYTRDIGEEAVCSGTRIIYDIDSLERHPPGRSPFDKTIARRIDLIHARLCLLAMRRVI